MLARTCSRRGGAELPVSEPIWTKTAEEAGCVHHAEEVEPHLSVYMQLEGVFLDIEVWDVD